MKAYHYYKRLRDDETGEEYIPSITVFIPDVGEPFANGEVEEVEVEVQDGSGISKRKEVRLKQKVYTEEEVEAIKADIESRLRSEGYVEARTQEEVRLVKAVTTLARLQERIEKGKIKEVNNLIATNITADNIDIGTGKGAGTGTATGIDTNTGTNTSRESRTTSKGE